MEMIKENIIHYCIVNNTDLQNFIIVQIYHVIPTTMKINFKIYKLLLDNLIGAQQGRSQGGKGGNSPPPPKPKKIVVEKWCYFRRLYF